MVEFGLWTKIHLGLFTIHLILGIVVFADPFISQKIAESATSIQFTRTSIVTGDSVYDATLNPAEVDPGLRLSPISIHGFVSILTAVSHLMSTVVYHDTGVCVQRPNYLRCFEYSITASLMTVSAYVSLGFVDFYMLLVVFTASACVQLCGLFMEAYKDTTLPFFAFPKFSQFFTNWDALKKWKQEQKPKEGEEQPKLWWYFFNVGAWIQFGIVLPVTIWTLSADPGTKVGVVAAWAFYVFYYTLFPINAVVDAKYVEGSYKTDQGQDKSFPAFTLTDKRYVVLSFCSKVTLFWITVCAIIYNMTEDEVADRWFTGLYLATFLPLGLTASFLFYSFRQTYLIRKQQKQEGKDEVVVDLSWQNIFFMADTKTITLQTKKNINKKIAGSLFF